MAQESSLASYGIEATDLYRRTASYVDRILKASNLADLPTEHRRRHEQINQHYVTLKRKRANGVSLFADLPRIS
jgi:ABC-type uncharacterized transport system substrate-binding protein